MTDEHVEQEAQPEQQQEDAAAEVDDRLLRLAADFDNYKKRAARERQEYVAFANERILKELLPILDDLERALSAAEHHEEAQRAKFSHPVRPWIVFFQNIDAIIGPDEPVIIPEHLTQEVDYELELAVDHRDVVLRRHRPGLIRRRQQSLADRSARVHSYDLAVERLRDRLVEAALLTGDYGPIGQRNADRRHLRAAARWLDESGSESKEARPFFGVLGACDFPIGAVQ